MKTNHHYIFQLFVKRLTGTLTDEETRLVEQVLDEDPKAARLMEELEASFLESDSLQDFYFNIGLEEEALFHAAEPPAPEQPAPLEASEAPPPLRVKRPRISPYRMAAAIAVLVALASLYFLLPRPGNAIPAELPEGVALVLPDGKAVALSAQDSQQINTGNAVLTATRNNLRVQTVIAGGKAGWNTLHVPAGHGYSLTLDDGSVIHLNAATQLRFAISPAGRQREMFISGEAYCNIASRAGQPFIVHTPRGDIMVLGTEFNVRSYDSSFTTSLVKGAVAVSCSNKKVMLRVGEEAALDSAAGLVVRKFDVKEVKAWMNGRYSFSNVSLHEVAGYIYRCYNTPVVFATRETADLIYSGLIDKRQPLDSFLLNLSMTNEVDSYRKNDTLYLRQMTDY